MHEFFSWLWLPPFPADFTYVRATIANSTIKQNK
ncbi:MAG TPA: hypothetical protein DCE81_10160 [Cytophagales bacterium]|nr:hypothetical protein [Cytophagales bacterium]